MSANLPEEVDNGVIQRLLLSVAAGSEQCNPATEVSELQNRGWSAKSCCATHSQPGSRSTAQNSKLSSILYLVFLFLELQQFEKGCETKLVTAE